MGNEWARLGAIKSQKAGRGLVLAHVAQSVGASSRDPKGHRFNFRVQVPSLVGNIMIPTHARQPINGSLSH